MITVLLKTETWETDVFTVSLYLMSDNARTQTLFSARTDGLHVAQLEQEHINSAMIASMSLTFADIPNEIKTECLFNNI